MGTSMNLSYVRGYNDAAVISRLRCVESASRAELAESTGLTPQAVSKILARLIEDGLVEEDGRRQGGRGKPAYLYRLRSEKAHAIGIHVRRTDIEGVIVDLAGTVKGSTALRLPLRFGPDELVEAIAQVVDELTVGQEAGTETAECGNIVGVGVATPGPVDHVTGVVQGFRWWPHPETIPLRAVLRERLGRHIVVDRTTNAALELVAWQRGERMGDALLALMDRGVGGALWVGGRLRRGNTTSAGEFGHTVIELDGPRCDCGRFGCVEIVHDEALMAGDPVRAARAVGVGIANALHVVDVPQILLAGDEFEQHAEVYEVGVREAVSETFAGLDGYRIERLVTDADLVATGAAVMVLEAFYGLPEPTSVSGQPG